MNKIKPIQVLNINRLDLVIKYLYAKNILQEKNDDKYIKKLYTMHIKKRTLFNRKFSDGKYSIDDYILTFSKLYDSIIKDGFDSKNKIQINKKNNIFFDGAHRISICLLLDIDIEYEHRKFSVK
jgi:hypothetical protein